MPLVVLTVGLAVVASYARGGRFSRIAGAQLGWTWLLFVGLGLQLLVDVVAPRDLVTGTQSYVLLLTSQVAVLGWVVANWWRPGMLLVGIGLLMNAVVMGANGAMPVDTAAIERLGVGEVEVTPGKHEVMTDETVLPWLADVHPVPPIRTIVSLGDVVLAAGLIPFVHHLMSYRTPAERRGGPRSSARTEHEAVTYREDVVP